MAEVTQEVNIEILEKLSDGKYKKKNPAPGAEVVKFTEGSTVEDHRSDYVLQTPYGVAKGSANAYTITLQPAPASYKEGMAVAVKIHATNTGASTININGLGAKGIRKANGNNVSAGNLKAGSIYSMRYNGANFILQGSDSAGNATPGDVLSGKTFSNDIDTDLIGTMLNRGTVIITPSRANQPIAGGYHSGNGHVKGDANLKAENIKEGVSIFGVTGTHIINFAAGDDLLIADASTKVTTRETNLVLGKSIKVFHSGIVRAKFKIEHSYDEIPGDIAYAKIYKNGSAITPLINHRTDGKEHGEDISVKVGDEVQVYFCQNQNIPSYSNYHAILHYLRLYIRLPLSELAQVVKDT